MKDDKYVEEKKLKLFARLLSIHGPVRNPLEIREAIGDFITTIVEDCKPKMSEKRIIEIQNLLLDVSEKETGVILAMARITGWLIEAGFEVEE